MKTTIKQIIRHDKMSLSAKLSSGASLKFSIGRSGEKLEIAFSNDPIVLKDQLVKMQEWLKFKNGETNLERFARLRQVLETSTNSIEVMQKLIP